MSNGSINATNSNITLNLPLFNEITNAYTQVKDDPILFVADVIGTSSGYPNLGGCYKNPLDCLFNYSVNFCADFNYKLLSTISSTFKTTINNAATYLHPTLNASLNDKIYPLIKPIYDPLEFFTTIGGKSSSEIPQINLLELAPHVMFFYFTTKKMKNNVVGVFDSFTKLFKGVFGKWTHETHLTDFESTKKDRYRMSVKIFRRYTFFELSEDIIFQSIFAATWGGLAFLTQRGIGNAIAETTDSIAAQHALTLLTAIIALSHFVPLNNHWKCSTQSQNFLSQNLPSFEMNKYPPILTTAPKKMTETKFDINKYNPIRLQEIRKGIDENCNNSKKNSYSPFYSDHQ
ncbi:MAG: hypothetical protein H0X29_09995 [Parachlamydiaceae bacterium]|nr:hypothetical protein [Parachlamydiaceae bacterium]